MKSPARPLAVDLFSGAGGMSLGFEQAGFDIAAAIELDPIHASVHQFNFPRCHTLPVSVAGLSGSEVRKLSHIEDRTVDVVFGGAPCQGFSLMGHRALNDPRNILVREFVRLVHELEAEYFVFENVKGLTVGNHVRFLEELIDSFDALGYETVTPWRVLNAAYFGVPQFRERLFLLGGRRGLPMPRYPRETTCIPGTISELPPTATCGEALGDLPDAELYAGLISGDAAQVELWGEPSDYAVEMLCVGESSWHAGYVRDWDPSILTSSMRTQHSDISRKRFSETRQGDTEPISRFYKLPEHGLSNTLRAGTDSSRGAFTSPRPIHYARNRCITVREMARLHGYPDWFRFHRTKWHGARQVGNSVPPPLARQVARSLIDTLGCEPSICGDILDLGDPSLLQMDMSQAAAYWGVEVPVARRDRKSGCKKRSQLEIESLRRGESVLAKARG